MADDRSRSQRSETMRRVRSRDTSCEISLRRAVWSRGGRYRLRSSLPGKPDMVFPGARVVVFVDGCFWHGCPAHCRVPASNNDYWRAKIGRNIDRDRAVTRELRRAGWRVVRVWEHSIAASPAMAAGRIVRVVNGGRRV